VVPRTTSIRSHRSPSSFSRPPPRETCPTVFQACSSYNQLPPIFKTLRTTSQRSFFRFQSRPPYLKPRSSFSPRTAVQRFVFGTAPRCDIPWASALFWFHRSNPPVQVCFFFSAAAHNLPRNIFSSFLPFRRNFHVFA